MSKLWQRVSHQEPGPAVEEVALDSVRITSPTVIYLSGFLTIDKKPLNAANGIVCMEELLHGRSELPMPPKIYAWSHTRLSRVFNIFAYGLRPSRACSAAAKKLATAVILPLIVRDGKILPAEEARKNLRNLTLFGYSAGSVLAQGAFNHTLRTLRKMGCTEDAARDLLREVVLISTGNMSRPTKESNRFTTLYLAASNDIFVRLKNSLWRPLRAVFRRYARHLLIKPLSKTSLLITAAVSKNLWEWRKNPNGGKTKRDFLPQLPSWTGLASHHELPHYVTTDDDHSQFSKIVMHGLINAARRQATLEVKALLEPCGTTDTAEEIRDYRARIARAQLDNPPVL